MVKKVKDKNIFYCICYTLYNNKNVHCSLTRRVNNLPKPWENKFDIQYLLTWRQEKKEVQRRDKKDKRTGQTVTDRILYNDEKQQKMNN